MKRYLKQYEEAKNGGYLDKEGNVILINPRGIPMSPTFLLKVEFAIVSFFSKFNLIFRDFTGRLFEI